MSTWTHPTCERNSGLVDAVVWDFGNVLTCWEPARAIEDRWPGGRFEELAARANFPALNERLDRGVSYAPLLEDLAAVDEEAAEFWEHYVANIGASLSPTIPGTRDLVDELADAGVPQYGLTNWPAVNAHMIPEVVQGVERLRGVVVSGLEGVIKPEPAIYELLIERFGLDPAATLFIDDRQVNLDAAEELGFQTHLFDGDAATLRSVMARLGLPVAA